MAASLGRSGLDRLSRELSPRRAGDALRRAPALLLLGILLSASVASAQRVPDASDHSTEFATSLGEDVSVAAGERVEQDLLTIGGRLVVDGDAGGDAVALDGDVVVRGHVAGDALALGGRVILEPGARVDGNAFSLFGGVDVAEGAEVGGRVRSLAPLAPGQEAGYFSTAFSKPALIARFLGLVFWILAALIAAFVAPATVARAAAEIPRHPLRLGGIGLLLGVSFLLTLILFVMLIRVFIGLPLLVLLFVTAVILVALALAAVFHALGERVSESLLEGAISGYVELLAGALLLGVLHFIPVLGELLWIAAALVGAGAVVTTRLARGRSRD